MPDRDVIFPPCALVRDMQGIVVVAAVVVVIEFCRGSSMEAVGFFSVHHLAAAGLALAEW